MVGGMGGDCICIMIDTGNNLGTLPAVKPGSTDTGGGTTGAAKEIDV